MKHKYLVALTLFGLIFSSIAATSASTAAVTVTWHESVKQDATFKWTVSKYANASSILFITERTKGIEYEVKITDVPPTDKVIQWSSIADTYSWADLYVNGTRSQQQEGFLLLFVTPLTTNQSGVEKPGYTIPYGAYSFLIAFVGIFVGALFQTTNSTDAGAKTWTGNIRSSFKVNDVIHDLNVGMVYSTETGLLKKFSYTLENTTDKEELEVVPVSSGLLGGLPGFEIPVTIGALFSLVPIVMLQKRRSKIGKKADE